MNPRVVEVVAMEEYRLLIIFSNGEIATFEVGPYLKDNFWAPLKNVDLFKAVKVAGGSIEWANGIDFCPDEIYEKSVILGKKISETQLAI